MLKKALVGFGCSALILAACGGESNKADSDTQEKRPTVLASFYPVAEMAQRLGNGVVDVKNLTPAGTEPHDLELSPNDIDAVKSASLVLYVGHGFAPAIEKAVSGRSGTSVDVTQGLALTKEPEQGHEHEGKAGHEEHVHSTDGLDPHFWLDPTMLSMATQKVEAALVQLAPSRQADIKSNANSYRDELAGLDREFKTGLAACKSKMIVTSHAAFGYMAARYGLEQHAIVLAPDAEPDPKQMAQLADLIKAEGVTTVFSEELVSSKVADALAREAKVKTAVLNPIEGLTKEEMNQKKDYRGVMQDNLKTLHSALVCS